MTDYCARGMCECDRETAICFANNISRYHPRHLNYLGTVLNDIHLFISSLF